MERASKRGVTCENLFGVRFASTVASTVDEHHFVQEATGQCTEFTDKTQREPAARRFYLLRSTAEKEVFWVIDDNSNTSFNFSCRVLFFFFVLAAVSVSSCIGRIVVAYAHTELFLKCAVSYFRYAETYDVVFVGVAVWVEV